MLVQGQQVPERDVHRSQNDVYSGTFFLQRRTPSMTTQYYLFLPSESSDHVERPCFEEFFCLITLGTFGNRSIGDSCQTEAVPVFSHECIGPHGSKSFIGKRQLFMVGFMIHGVPNKIN